MSVLTRLLLLLTLLALLPVGSFNLKFGGNLRPAAVISTQLEAILQDGDTSVSTPSRETRFAAALKRCNGPGIPGSGCNPALVVLLTEVSLAFTSPATALRPAGWPQMTAYRTPPLLGPPRLV